MFWNFESYNPPISRDNWANKDSLEERADRLCHKSTYLQAPPEWLGEQFLAEAEHLKETDERAYQHEYLGIPVGTGGNVFDKLELREITDEEVKSFDRIYQGWTSAGSQTRLLLSGYIMIGRERPSICWTRFTKTNYPTSKARP